jgi:hypothetical protein
VCDAISAYDSVRDDVCCAGLWAFKDCVMEDWAVDFDFDFACSLTFA